MDNDFEKKNRKIMAWAIIGNALIFLLGASLLMYGVYGGYKLVQAIDDKGLKTVIEEIWEGDQSH